MSNKTRKIWIQEFGPIPKDEFGFSYEIHHKDGIHANNDINNLQMVTIHEHLEIHLKQGDWGAAALIGKRIGLGPTYASDIQRGKKRPGVGGRPKGTPSESKGKKVHTEEQKQKWSEARKGKIHSTRINEDIIHKIRMYYIQQILIDGMVNIGKNGKNGRKITYDRLFANHFSKEYGISATYVYNIITNKEIRPCIN